MTENEERIAGLARAINHQLNILAEAEARKIKNIWITEGGQIREIQDHLLINNSVEDDKRVLEDLLRQLDQALKERDAE